MIYKFNYTEAALEFVKNQGRAFLEAESELAALSAARELFSLIRDETVESLGDGQYLVSFKVSLEFKLPRLREVEKAVRMLRDLDLYLGARYIERYILAIICLETGQPEWLVEAKTPIRTEISTLRKAAVVSREVANVRDFVDWDIVIYNYLEINTKSGYQCRVVRQPRPRQEA